MARPHLNQLRRHTLKSLPVSEVGPRPPGKKLRRPYSRQFGGIGGSSLIFRPIN
jgi:hypothetical protein